MRAGEKKYFFSRPLQDISPWRIIQELTSGDLTAGSPPSSLKLSILKQNKN